MVAAYAHLPSFDLELPIECDDDHWIAEDSDDPFQQPEGEPSDISYFIWSLQLSDILALVVRKSVGYFFVFLPG